MSGDNLAEALKAIWDHIEKISTEMDKLRTCLQALQNDVQIQDRPIRMAGSSSNYAASSPTIGQPTMWNGSNQPVPLVRLSFKHHSNFNHGMNASTSGMQASMNSPFMQPVAPNSAPIRMAGSSSYTAASSSTIGQPTMWNGSNQPVPCPPQLQTPFPSSNFNRGMNASTSGMQASANSPFMQPVAPNSALHGYQYGDASMFPHYNSNN